MSKTTLSTEVLSGFASVGGKGDMSVRFSERLQSRISPEILESETFDDVVRFIERGGRLRAIDYTKTVPEQKTKGFRRAREYLNQPIHSVVDGKDILNPAQTYHHPNPNDPTETFAPIHPLPKGKVEEVMTVASSRGERPDPVWDGPENFLTRQGVLDRFLAEVYINRHVYAAFMALCQGKTGFEVFRDMQEHFDFWREYREVGEVMRYNESLLRSNGDTTLEYRALDGVVGIWQPFNFSCIGVGDTSAALLMGNAVVIHTSARNVGTYKWLYEKLLKAGVPPERVQFIIPHDDPDPAKVDTSMSEALAAHPSLQLIQFTGSHAVARKLHAIQAKKVQEGVGRLDYRLQAEASGYNPFVVTGLPGDGMERLRSFLVMGCHEDDEPTPEAWDHFFLEIETEEGSLRNFLRATVDSVTGLQAHKCSTCKEFIVAIDPSGKQGMPPVDASMLKLLLAECLKRVKIGPIENGGVDMGGLIDAKMYNLVRRSLQRIVEEGGQLLTTDTPKDIDGVMEVEGQPQAMRVAFYDVPKGNLDTMDKVEIFAPVVRWNAVQGVDAAIARATDLGYALTATVVAPTEREAKEIRKELPHGVVYISGDEGGIDGCTGAPAPQIPFGGSGKSGTGSAYRPGNTRYPLAFVQEVSRPRFSRAEWGKGKHPTPTSDVLDSIARRDPSGVLKWVQENVNF